jgi:hypothetical protein
LRWGALWMFNNRRTAICHRFDEIPKILKKIWRPINPREGDARNIKKNDDDYYLD